MKFSYILPLAALSTAFVIPDEQVMSQISVESHETPASLLDKLPSKDDVLDGLKSVVEEVAHTSKNALDEAIEYATDASNTLSENVHAKAFDAEAWLSSSIDGVLDEFGGGDHPPHHGPPDEDHPPHHDPPHHDDPHHPPHHGPHHPPHDHKPNMTIYQLITESKYTTKLAKLIKDDNELVKVLNGTAANYTIFAPSDRAFEKIPEHAPKPSKEEIRELLLYHISPEFYPAGRVLRTHTIPTLHKEAALGKKPLPQRLSINVGFRGLTVNFYSRIVAVNVFGTNGVIHGVDSIIIPPPKTIDIIDLLPSEFSTLELGLGKTGLLQTLNTTKHAGGTFFAPSNFAFRKLGPRINAFLFSKYGQKYLKALLEYHVVANQTLYSDAYYDNSNEKSKDDHRGQYHFELPTLLDNRHLSVDVGRYGPFISIRVNGFSRVTVQDGIAKDGVIQVVSDVLIPPKRVGGSGEEVQWQGEEMSVEEFKQRLEPLVKKSWKWDL